MRCEPEPLTPYKRLGKFSQMIILHYTLFYIPHYPPLRLCGAVLLVPPPYEPNISLNPLLSCRKFVYQAPCNILHICCLSPPIILLYRPTPCDLQIRVHQGPLPLPIILFPCCNFRNQYWDPVMKSLQNRHHCVRHHPDFAPIQVHLLDCHLTHNCPGFDWDPCITQYLF